MNKVKMTQTYNKLKFKTIKNSPKILVGLGITGIVGSIILSCAATLKVSDVIEEHNEVMNKINKEVSTTTVDEIQEDYRKEKTVLYANTCLKITKLYIPSAILATISIGAILQSHKILNSRNAALAAALTTTSESFSRYRKSVVDRYGERVDHELRHGIKSEKVTTTETDENGKVKTKKENIDVVSEGIEGYSDYSRFYDDGCKGWEKDSEYNLMFLKAQQQYANDKLVAKGYLFLNEVYNMLGIPESKAGQVVGWVYDPENPVGDNYVDFGIFDVSKKNSRDFVNGYEKTILLDFNVDGNIWDKM